MVANIFRNPFMNYANFYNILELDIITVVVMINLQIHAFTGYISYNLFNYFFIYLTELFLKISDLVKFHEIIIILVWKNMQRVTELELISLLISIYFYKANYTIYEYTVGVVKYNYVPHFPIQLNNTKDWGVPLILSQVWKFHA